MFKWAFIFAVPLVIAGFLAISAGLAALVVSLTVAIVLVGLAAGLVAMGRLSRPDHKPALASTRRANERLR